MSLASWKKTLRHYLGGLFRELSHKTVFLFAQAIAFKVLVTMVPVVILTTGVVGQVLQLERPFETVAGLIRDFLPVSQRDGVIEFVAGLQRVGGALTFVGIIGLILSAVTLFTTLRIVVSEVFRDECRETRSVLRGYAFDLRMVGQVGLLFLLTFSVSLAAQALNAVDLGVLQRIGLDALWFQQGWRRLLTVLGLLVPFILSTIMFFQLYYFVPTPRPLKRSAALGAAVAAVLWEGAKYGFTFYATHLAHFERYGGQGAEDSIAAVGDTFGLIIAFVFWVYFSGLVLSIGALIALLHEQRNREEPSLVGAPL
jgi:membrane protein